MGFWGEISEQYNIDVPFSEKSRYDAMGESFIRRPDIAKKFIDICLENKLSLAEIFIIMDILMAPNARYDYFIGDHFSPY